MKVNRETWLQHAMNLLDRDFFAANGYELPDHLAVSCGWPKGSKAIGECWKPEVCADGTTHMFISPTQDNEIEVLQVLLHEMIHAWDGCEHGHKGPFVKLMKEFGMAGKATATVAEEGGELWNQLALISAELNKELGAYPHKAVKKRAPRKSNPSAWVRLYSVSAPDYKVVVSPKMLEEHGAPLDPFGEVMLEVVK